MSSRSERYLANAEKCQQFADAANTSGTKRLYGVLASQWRQLTEEADWTDKMGSRPFREFGVALKREPLPTPKEHRQLADQ